MKRLYWLIIISLLSYIVYNEHRFWDYEHVAWDAQTAVCIALPPHCAGGNK